MTGLGFFEYMLFMGATYMLLLTERRFALVKTCAIVYGVTVLIGAFDVYLYSIMDPATFAKIFALANHLPLFCLFIYLSKSRGWRAVFLVLVATLFCFLVFQATALVAELFGGHPAIYIVGYLGLGAVAVPLFIVRFFRSRYFAGLSRVEHGWWLMCLVIAVYYAINTYLVPDFVGTTRAATIIKPAVSVLMVGFFSALVLLFSSAQRESDARERASLLAVQIEGLTDRAEAVRAASEALRIERHDMRHRLQTVRELIARGQLEEACAFLDDATTRLDEQRPTERFCRLPVLDAVLSTYIDEAERAGIRVDAHVALPETLPVDEAELAVVCANALENAVRACRAVPSGEREIRVRMIARPSLMVEISNPCVGAVRYGADGLPEAAAPSHGVGVRSIAAFAEKHGATCEFKEEFGRFTFLLVL